MPKVYFIAPLVALALFAAVFFNFKSGHRAHEQARLEQVAAAKEAKLKAEADARRAAIEEALRAQEQRKKEREAKEAADLAEKAVRQALIDTRDKARLEQDKLARQLERVRKDLVAEQETAARLEAVAASATSERDFLRDFVAKAEASVKKFQDALARMESAERARAAEAAVKKS